MRKIAEVHVICFFLRLARNAQWLIVLCALSPFQTTAAEKSFNTQAGQEEFQEWQNETRQWLVEALYKGPGPEAVPLEPVIEKSESRGNYDLFELSFHDRPGHVTKGWLAKPHAPVAEKLPAVIALHGHGGTAYDTFNPEGMYYYGHALAKKGYIVLALDINHFQLEHVVYGFIRFCPLWMADVPFPHMGQRLWMVRRAVDLLETMPDVNADSIGVVGLSNGGITAMYVAACEPRIKLAVSSGALIMHERMWHSNLIHCRCQYLKGMDGQLEYYDVFALAAPRPLVVQNGLVDTTFPIESAREAFDFIGKAYEIAGAKDKVVHDVHDGAHRFRDQVPMQWFDKYMPVVFEGN